ncbi:MAG: AAA family ATPase [Marinobacter sp.]|nr:AAA family ATPase [Marinobacter sp.]
MTQEKSFGRISASPTNPHPRQQARDFDISTLIDGPLQAASESEVQTAALDEKLRQAYFWIINHAVISPHYDIEYNQQPPQVMYFGDSRTPLVLPSDQSYSSFILLPLLTFAARRKCLFIGGPGRGKTASALLMGVLAGYSPKQVKQGMQHGHPQMTVADLLGNPMPHDLMKAEVESDIRISWRQWLDMGVKIVDEYNRIPTRTQSSLLTLMGDNYAEMFNQIKECPPAAWFLTANDDQGGGTYQVIEALKDRIDVVVQALGFNPRFLDELLLRIEEGVDPTDYLPESLRFTPEELDILERQIRAVKVPDELRRRIEFFASQFEFSEYSGQQFEYKSKDTSRLAGIPSHQLAIYENGKDRLADLGCQTVNGLSVRSLMSLLVYAKAMAFFRGNTVVELNDITQMLPFVFHSRLFPDLDAPFFQQAEHAAFRSDRIGWLRHLFITCCQEFERQGLHREDPAAALKAELDQGLDGVSLSECRQRLQRIEQQLLALSKGNKLTGAVYDDALLLKYLHQRYSNYLRWLTSQG